MFTCNHLIITRTRNIQVFQSWEFVTAAQSYTRSHTSRPMSSLCRLLSITGRTSYLRVKSWFHFNRQNSRRRDGVDVGSQLKLVCMQAAVKLMEISLCSSLDHHAHPLLPFLPHLSPLPPLYSLPSYRQSLHASSLSPPLSSPLHCWSCPCHSSAHPLWHNKVQKCIFVWSQHSVHVTFTKPDRASRQWGNGDQSGC